MKHFRVFSPRPWLVLLVAGNLTAAPLCSPAQCVLCSSQVEAARQEKDGYEPGGLNKGILYLMTIPYILMAAVGYGWYQSHWRKATARPRYSQPPQPPNAPGSHWKIW